MGIRQSEKARQKCNRTAISLWRQHFFAPKSDQIAKQSQLDDGEQTIN